MRHPEDCKIESKLAEMHKWAHYCLTGVSREELSEAHQLGNEILEVLNTKLTVNNGIKFLALFEAIAVGIDILEREMEMLQEATGPIN